MQKIYEEWLTCVDIYLAVVRALRSGEPRPPGLAVTPELMDQRWTQLTEAARLFADRAARELGASTA